MFTLLHRDSDTNFGIVGPWTSHKNSRDNNFKISLTIDSKNKKDKTLVIKGKSRINQKMYPQSQQVKLF